MDYLKAVVKVLFQIYKVGITRTFTGGKKVVFINIGRGNIITEVELVKALEQQWISGAILDVFETEPLPKNSILWSLPNVTKLSNLVLALCIKTTLLGVYNSTHCRQQ